MRHLIVSVRFLGDRYHGLTDDGREPEWPPSPMRLFQAMLAGAKSRWSDATAEAFKWLERQPPPSIIALAAPHARPGRTLLIYVPNNNDPGSNERTAKVARPTLLDGDRMVTYVWPLAVAEDETQAAIVTTCARHIRVLGWGIDLAIGHGCIADSSPAPSAGQRVYRPVPAALCELAGGIALRVPTGGSLGSLEAAYAASLQRFADATVLTLAPPAVEFKTVVYTTSIVRPFCAFRFVGDDDRPPAYRPRHIKQLAGHLRHLAADAVKGLATEQQIDGMILGHPKDGPRLSISPLPSIGHPYSDGLIRRALLAEPHGGDGSLCTQLARRLQGCPVAFEGACDCPVSELDTIGRGDRVLGRYVAESCTWASVTPVLLPGHNERRQRRRDHARAIARAQSLICKSLAQAGIGVMAEIELDQVPYWRGALHARDYDPRGKLANLPRFHVKLTFAQPVSGPLSIGAGRHVGFGVLAACSGSTESTE